MSYDSKIKFPAPEMPIEDTVEKLKQYISAGLTKDEASDLVAMENAELKGGNLIEIETDRIKRYMKKMGKAED